MSEEFVACGFHGMRRIVGHAELFGRQGCKESGSIADGYDGIKGPRRRLAARILFVEPMGS